MLPVSHVLSLLVFSKLFAGFLVHHLYKRLPSVMTAMQTNLMQCAAYGLSTDRLTPYPFNLCSNAGITHTSISQTQPLDMTLSMCTQLLWSTMARPVLSGIFPVKPLYVLGHSSVSGSWQTSYSLRHLYVEQKKKKMSDPQRVPYQLVTSSHVGWPTNWDLARATYPHRV